MIRRLVMAALVAVTVGLCAPPQADAQQIPKREYASISNATAYVATVPALQNGTLNAVRLWRCVPTNATLTVSHTYKVGALTVTNTLGTVSGDLSGNGSVAFTNAYVVPGDWLLYKFSAPSTGTVEIVRGIPAN